MEDSIKEETKGVRTERVNFFMRYDLLVRLDALCSHKGDKSYYLNQAMETWLNQNEEKVMKFNEKIKG